jgi:acid phosphatase
LPSTRNFFKGSSAKKGRPKAPKCGVTRQSFIIILSPSAGYITLYPCVGFVSDKQPHKRTNTTTTHHPTMIRHNLLLSLTVLLTLSTCLCLASPKLLSLRQVLIVHRHGDRTPITPLVNEEFWKSTLPEPHILDGIAKGTELIREEGYVPNQHGAVGRVPFGQLTMMGLLQMVSLGERLREELGHVYDSDDNDSSQQQRLRFVNNGRLFTPTKPLHPRRISVISTDFPRTIQSVQALLTGLFPQQDAQTIKIDLRNTNSYLIPDPQPRQSPLQPVLEKHLAERPHLQEREKELEQLSLRISNELKGHLGEGAQGVSFGIGEEKDTDDANEQKPLPWAQMSEILTCLHSRSLLPPSLTSQDVETVSSHVAWRWFENLQHPVLAKTAMWKFANGLLESMERRVEIECRCCDCVRGDQVVSDEECIDEPWLRIYSAHDSTLIGLLCLLKLEKPVEWPEYGSYLKMELIREENEQESSNEKPKYWVRFSLNGQILRSTWCLDENDEPVEMVPLNELEDMIHLEHELCGEDDSTLKFSWKSGLLTKH